MAKEQEEAVDYVQKQIDYFKEQIKFIEAVDSDYYDEEYGLYKNRVKQFETVLNMLKEKDAELEKKEKMINKMIDEIMIHYQVKTMRKMCCPACKIGERACTYSGIHRNCIKQYFERKSKK